MTFLRSKGGEGNWIFQILLGAFCHQLYGILSFILDQFTSILSNVVQVSMLVNLICERLKLQLAI